MLIAWQMKFDTPVENRWTTQTCYFRACLHGCGGPQVGEVTRLAVVEKWNAFTCNPRSAVVKFREVVVGLAIREFEHRRSKLTSWERRKINSRTRMYHFMKGSRVVLRGVRLREEPLTHYVFWNSLGNEIWSIYNAKYSEMWTFYTPCVFVAVSGDFCHETAKKCTKF